MADDLIPLVEGLAAPRVLVVGDYMLDRYLWGSVDRISPEAPIPVLRVDRRNLRPGGAGSVCACLAALGARPIPAGIVGEDTGAESLAELLEEIGADTAGLQADSSRPTTVKTRMIARSQQMLRVDEESNEPIDAEVEDRLARFCIERARSEADAIIVQDHAKGTVRVDLVARLAEVCAERGIPLVVDPALDADYGKYAGATVLTPNRAEAQRGTGVSIRDESSAEQAGRNLIERLRLRAALITLDREGIAVVEDGRETVMAPADAREVFDVAGAGDIVAAMVTAAVASGYNLPDAARLANLAAGIEVGKVGVATVTRAEMMDRLKGRADSVVRSRSDLQTVCSDLHARGRTLVFTNGCFDLLHIGHVHLLSKAKEFGDVLIVAINSDRSARRIKGAGRPIIPEDARAEMLAALQCVDYVTIYDEDTPIPLLEIIRPDVIVKGGEYGKEGVVGGELVESMGGRIENVQMIDGVSTTDVARRAGLRAEKESGERGYVDKHNGDQ